MRVADLRDNIAVLKDCWHDHFSGVEPPPSQFATWLRLYPIDVVAQGFQAGNRWLARLRGSDGKHGKKLADLIPYVSACMRNINDLRKMDAEAQQ